MGGAVSAFSSGQLFVEFGDWARRGLGLAVFLLLFYARLQRITAPPKRPAWSVWHVTPFNLCMLCY